MKFLSLLLVVILPVVLITSFVITPSKVFAYSNPATVSLGTVSNFAALAHTTITSPTGPTILSNGDLGTDGVCTGFPSPCTASGNGTINNGSIQYQNTAATTGQGDATTAVGDIGGRSADETLSAQLGGQTLTQGIYDVPDAATNLTGDLTLNGDANSIFIFRMAARLITDNGSRVVLGSGVQACHVFWMVASSATFNDTTTFVGTVLAQASISFPGGGATLNGRAVAQTGAITFNNTTVNNSSCASPTPTTTPTATPTSSSGPSSSSSSGVDPSTTVCPSLNYVVPIIIGSKRIGADSISISWGPYSGINTFIVSYGLENGKWLYNTKVTGFSTTINNLPANQPIWVRVASTDNCSIGNYGASMLVGGSGVNPTMAPTGSMENTLLVMGTVMLTIIGGALLLFL